MAQQSGETLTYDAAGNIVYQGVSSNKFQRTKLDAAGRQAGGVERWQTTSGSPQITTERTVTSSFDGDGRSVKSETVMQRIGEAPAAPSTVYKIYSSVLGSELTEMNYLDGAFQYQTTKVYAGGAIIAEQRKETNTVVWFHADPVTGSKQEVSINGQAIDTIKARQEYEPLGQSVRTTEPVSVDPPNDAPPINDSLFPEWQCKLPKEVMPTHCALKLLADVKNDFTNWGAGNKEGNVSQVTNGLQKNNSSSKDIPRNALASSSLKQMMSYGLISSIKKVDDEDDGEVIDMGGVRVPRLPSDIEKKFSAENDEDELEEQRSLVNETANLTRSILQAENKCFKFFGKDAIEVLNGLVSKLDLKNIPNATGVGIRMSYTEAPKDIGTTSGGRNYIILISALVNTDLLP